MFRTAEAKRFFAAWQTLRTDNDIPHYRRVFQDLPPDMLPNMMMFEQTPRERGGDEHYIVRFMGTHAAEQWGADITGRDLLDTVSRKTAAAARRNYATLLQHPCGLLNLGNYSVEPRGELAVEGMLVPVSNTPGLPQRILCFTQQIVPPYTLAQDRLDAIDRRWVDLGHGVPGRKPAP